MEYVDNTTPSEIARRLAPPTRRAFCVRTLGRMCDQPYHTTLGTYHQDAMLTCVLSGRGWYVRAGQRQAVTPGQLGLVLPGGDTGMLMADPADPYDHLYCRFAGQEALDLAHAIARRHVASVFFISPVFQEVADTLLRGMRWGRSWPLGRRTDDRPLRQDAALQEVLCLLHQPAPAGPLPVSAERLHQYFDDHLAEPIRLEVLADHLAMSKAHLCRVGRRLLGQTVQHAWEAAKIHWATLLLREPSLNITETARRVGYDDPLYFSKVFRRRTGQSPSDFRRGLH